MFEFSLGQIRKFGGGVGRFLQPLLKEVCLFFCFVLFYSL